jgi:hypothetical protein
MPLRQRQWKRRTQLLLILTFDNVTVPWAKAATAGNGPSSVAYFEDGSGMI